MNGVGAAMDDLAEKSGDRARTRAKLVNIFNSLLLSGESGRPKVADVIAAAGVARSTFYDHFDGIEALSNESLESIFSPLSDGILGRTKVADLQSLLAHIWTNRTLAREILMGAKGERAEALLALLLEQRLQGQKLSRLNAILIAGTTVSALSAWVSGKVSTSAEDLAATLVRAAEAILSNQTV